MQNPIVHNQYGNHEAFGSAPSTETQIEMNIKNYAVAHEHEHVTQNGHWTHCDQENTQMEALANDAQNELNALQSQNSGESTVQNALNVIQDNFKEEAVNDSQLKIISNLDRQFHNAIQYDKANEHYYTRYYSLAGCDYSTVEHTHASMVDGINHAEQSRQTLNPLLTQLESNMEALDPSKNLSDLFASLNGFVGESSSQNSNPSFLDNKDETQAINTLLGMIKEQIEVDAGMQEESDGEIKELSIHEMLILESKQSSGLASLSSHLESSYLATNKDIGNDASAINGFNSEELLAGSFGYNDSNKKLKNDGLLKQNANHLYQAIYAAQNDLTQVSADVASNAFESLMLSINEVMKDVEKVLSNPKLSAKAKEAKLAQLLQLMLGFLQMFIQAAQNLRSENKQKMEKATIVAQKTNLQDIQTQAQTIQEIHAQEKSLKILHTVMQWVEIAATAAFIVTGTVGVALAMTTMLVLDKTGTTKKWTNDLANDEHSKVGGSATMTGIAMAATMLGGVGIDLLTQQMEVMAEDAIQVNVNDVVTKATEKLGGTAAGAMVDPQAEEVITMTVKAATKQAIKNATKEFYKDLSFASATKMMMAKARGEANQKFEVFVKESVETAIKNAVKEVSESGTPAAQITPEIIQTASEKAAASIVKKTVRSEEDFSNAPCYKKPFYYVSKAYYAIHDKMVEALPSVVRSGMWAGVYMATDTNLFVDLTLDNQSAKSAANEKSSKVAEKTTMQVIQMLIQMIAEMKGGGFTDLMDSINGSTVVQGMQRASAVTQVGNSGVQSGSNFVQYGIDQKEANAIEIAKETQAYNELAHELSNQDHASAASNAGLSTEEKRLADEQLWLSTHVWDGTNAACRVLAAQSI